MLRNVGAVLLGLFVGSTINMALIMLNSFVLFPMPEGTDMANPEQFAAYIAGLPAVAFILPMIAHLGQSFVGGWVAARVGASRPMLLAMIVGVLSMLGGIMNMLTIKGPAWFYVEIPLYLVVAWLAGTLEVKRRAAAEAA